MGLEVTEVMGVTRRVVDDFFVGKGAFFWGLGLAMLFREIEVTIFVEELLFESFFDYYFGLGGY